MPLDTVSDAWDSATDAVSSGASSLSDAASSAWDTVESGWDSTWDAVQSGASTVGDYAGSAVGSMWDTAVDYGPEIASGAATGFMTGGPYGALAGGGMAALGAEGQGFSSDALMSGAMTGLTGGGLTGLFTGQGGAGALMGSQILGGGQQPQARTPGFAPGEISGVGFTPGPGGSPVGGNIPGTDISQDMLSPSMGGVPFSNIMDMAGRANLMDQGGMELPGGGGEESGWMDLIGDLGTSALDWYGSQQMMEDYEDLMQQQMERADRFGEHRDFYADRLHELMQDEEQFAVDTPDLPAMREGTQPQFDALQDQVMAGPPTEGRDRMRGALDAGPDQAAGDFVRRQLGIGDQRTMDDLLGGYNFWGSDRVQDEPGPPGGAPSRGPDRIAELVDQGAPTRGADMIHDHVQEGVPTRGADLAFDLAERGPPTEGMDAIRSHMERGVDTRGADMMASRIREGPDTAGRDVLESMARSGPRTQLDQMEALLSDPSRIEDAPGYDYMRDQMQESVARQAGGVMEGRHMQALQRHQHEFDQDMLDRRMGRLADASEIGIGQFQARGQVAGDLQRADTQRWAQGIQGAGQLQQADTQRFQAGLDARQALHGAGMDRFRGRLSAAEAAQRGDTQAWQAGLQGRQALHGADMDRFQADLGAADTLAGHDFQRYADTMDRAMGLQDMADQRWGTRMDAASQLDQMGRRDWESGVSAREGLLGQQMSRFGRDADRMQAQYQMDAGRQQQRFSRLGRLTGLDVDPVQVAGIGADLGEQAIGMRGAQWGTAGRALEDIAQHFG